MNDTPLRGTPKLSERDLLVLELIEEANRDVERMEAANEALEGLDSTSWHRIYHVAHNLAARAGALNLVVLQQGASELERFAMDVLEGDTPDKPKSVYAAMVAIEILALEIESLRKSLGVD